ncbi:MAG: hypothetical protein KF770_03675 [Anaerolineae bacterium]|nr:hypothetical protein [Anaerolineae bacterium]
MSEAEAQTAAVQQPHRTLVTKQGSIFIGSRQLHRTKTAVPIAHQPESPENDPEPWLAAPLPAAALRFRPN